MSNPKVVLSDPDWNENTIKRFAPAGDTVLEALDSGGICSVSRHSYRPGFFTVLSSPGYAVLSTQQLLQLIRELQVLAMSPHPNRNGRS